MKKFLCFAALIFALTFVSCVKKADVQADIQAINALLEEWESNVLTANVEWLLSKYYADEALRLAPNRLPLEGKEAVRASLQAGSDLYDYGKVDIRALDVKVSGDLAVARGDVEVTATPKTGGEAFQGKNKWVALYQRQPDGSWRCSYDIWNSDQPAPGTSEGGIEEKTLIQTERDWADADIKADTVALDKIMAAGWTNNEDGQVTKKAQALADLKSGVIKVESVVLSDLKTAVFGDTATVFGLWTTKSTQRGKDMSGQYRFADVFKKLEGRWQAVATYSTKVQ
jgi:ketosteroid isomerase-like protein